MSEPVSPEKIAKARVAVAKALFKVCQHYKLNPMELIYASHEAVACIGDYNDELWGAFVVASFMETMKRNEPKLVTH
jgi:hypothetical protein